MKIWVTKWVLTEGIQEYDVEPPKSGSTLVKITAYGYAHGEGKEWHRSRDAAVTRAEELRLKKITAVKKQLARLERMTFN